MYHAMHSYVPALSYVLVLDKKRQSVLLPELLPELLAAVWTEYEAGKYFIKFEKIGIPKML